MALVSDIVVAAAITGSLALASVIAPIYLRNKRSMRKISAEEFIENFMKRQELEILRKDELLTERDTTIRNLEAAVKKLSQKTYRYESMVKELRSLIKELREENREEKKQSEVMKVQLQELKDNYEKIYAKKFVEAVKSGKIL